MKHQAGRAQLQLTTFERGASQLQAIERIEIINSQLTGRI